ncbi:MAG: NfeD family protein [Calditrichia bacterium]
MKSLLLKLLLLLIPATSSVFGQVYHIDISGMIDLGLPPYIERVIEDAEANNAKAILLEVNTFGGRVDAATQIKDLLLNSNLPTYAYVNKRAISAGALISLSCDTIGMAPGSSMGAATVVDGEGQKQAEKAQSYFRAEMGATAESKGRNREIAEAMVDEDIEIEGLIEKGKLITLTSEDAIKYEMAEISAPSIEAFLDSVGLGGANIVYNETTFGEKFIRFLTGPVISSILLMMIFAGIFFELQTPGWGVAGSMALLGLILFFGSHYIIQLATSWEILLFIVGVLLLLVELLILPGFGVAGILGVTFIIVAAFLSLIGSFETVSSVDLSSAATRLTIVLLLTILGMVVLYKMGVRSTFWDRIALAPEFRAEDGFTSSDDYSGYLGKVGVTATPLRPAGVGVFDNRRLDIVSEGGFIEANENVEIISVEGYRLTVRSASSNNSSKT